MKLLIIPPDSIKDNMVSLPRKDLHHIRTVLRKKKGDSLDLADGTNIYRGEISFMSDTEIIVSSLCIEKKTPQTTPVTLAHSLIKGPNLELALTKAVETGIYSYQPLVSARCHMPSQSLVTRKRERLLKKIDEAAKQCGRPSIMDLQEMVKLNHFLQELQGKEGLKLFLDIKAEKKLLEIAGEIQAARFICLLIGPEGGFTDEEREEIIAAGFLAVTCGDFLWRSETAAIVTSGFVQTVLASIAPDTQKEA